ncbi:unnamed protein product [Rhizoctonia solani]|uniref:Epoxide hydrolase N-terminal domain-containing protein n=1 Tax=Rhizoctonia solani TaxID=456999 RepID=A0A8H3CYF4_9AGAM|nr:unnamed protein product [Rhizoctonia solani]
MAESNDYNLRPFKVHIPDEEIERTKTLLRMQRLPDDPVHPGITSEDGVQHTWMHEAKRHLDEEIERTKTLLRMQRLPDDPVHPGITSEDGVQHTWMHEAKRHLLEFDWRTVENKLNSFSQYLVTIEGATIHFIHEKSKSKSAIPLLLLHGWPSSILEFHKVIEPLVNAPDGQQAFDVVIPSLPGVGYSTLLPKPGATVVDNARVFDTLMTNVLGYETYVGQGGDFGAINLRQLQTNHSNTLKLAYLQTNHSNTLKLALFQMFLAPRPADAIDDSLLSTPEQTLIKHAADFRLFGDGHFLLQCNRVSTIGLAMYDNPQAYLAWMAFKYIKALEWGNLPEDIHQTYMDEMCSAVLLQQYTGTIHTSMVMYQQNGLQYGREEWKKNPPNQAPFGVQHFEGTYLLTPPSWVKNHGPMIWHQYHKSGGHFAALGAPQEFVDDCRWFFGRNYWNQLQPASSTRT